MCVGAYLCIPSCVHVSYTRVRKEAFVIFLRTYVLEAVFKDLFVITFFAFILFMGKIRVTKLTVLILKRTASWY